MVLRTNAVTSDYFRTLGMTVVAGRSFTDHDAATDPQPVIVNEAFGRKYFRNDPATGRSFAFGNGRPMPIVGVVADARYDGLREPSVPMAFFPAAPDGMLQSIEARVAVDSRTIVPALRRAITSADPRLPLRELFTVEQLVDTALAKERLMARISGFFGLLALVLATVGIYALLAHLVTERTSEIGIRMALGAERSRVVALVLREGALLIVPGVVLGVGLALLATRVTASLLFDVSPADPVALTLAPVCLIAAGFVAAYLPARRAASIDPLRALRHE
jgi:predicted permease